MNPSIIVPHHKCPLCRRYTAAEMHPDGPLNRSCLCGWAATDNRAWLVGENNPYGSDPEYALFPRPRSSAGGRLCYRILGMTANQYLASFMRDNLTTQKWSMAAARERAARLVEAARPGGVLILLGVKVARAFGIDTSPYQKRRVDRSAYIVSLVGSCTLVTLPHPSGLNRAWNAPNAMARARALVADQLREERNPEPFYPANNTLTWCRSLRNLP